MEIFTGKYFWVELRGIETNRDLHIRCHLWKWEYMQRRYNVYTVTLIGSINEVPVTMSEMAVWLRNSAQLRKLRLQKTVGSAEITWSFGNAAEFGTKTQK